MHFLFYFFIFYLTGSISSFGESINHLEKIRETFLYGSYQEQLRALGLYTKKKIDGENGDDYLKLLDLIIKENPHNAQVYIKLIEVIEENKIKSHYSLFDKMLTEEFLEEDFLGNYKQVLISKTLRVITDLELSKYNHLPVKFFSDEDLHENNPSTLLESARGIGVFKRPKDKELLTEKYKEIISPQVQEEILRSISKYQDAEDIDFFRSIIYSEESRSILKWIALVCLKEYLDSEIAFDILKSTIYSDNIDMRSRAIYTISFFKKDGLEDLLIKASKEDNIKIRYQAVLGLAQYESGQVNDLLKYKMKHDPEKSIRDKARDILKERGLIKENEEK